MPKIKDIKPNFSNIIQDIKKINGIKSLYIWGSYATNQDNPNFRVKDIDIIAKTNLHSGDLLAIDKKIIDANLTKEFLEEQGYHPEAIKFSKEFLNFSKYNIDHWVISSDDKLLHWGAIIDEKKEADNLQKEADKYANYQTGFNRKKINISSENNRKNWYNCQRNYLNQYFYNMPSGWYCSSEENIKQILSKAIKI